MAQHHKYSISDVEDLMPYERDIYVDMLITFMNEKKENEEKGR